MSSHEDDVDQEINVDVDSDSRESCVVSGSEIDMEEGAEEGGSCYDDSETALR